MSKNTVQDLRDYLEVQFQATVGHIPLRDRLDDIEAHITNLDALCLEMIDALRANLRYQRLTTESDKHFEAIIETWEKRRVEA